MRYLLLVLVVLVAVNGCHSGYNESGKYWHHRKHEDTLRREYVPTCNQPILEAARAVTAFEDSLRRDGTITVKTPDVWGDSNLMHSIQEFDNELESSLGKFQETLQGTMSVSDVALLASEIVAKIGIDGATPADPPEKSVALPDAQAPFASLASLSGLLPKERKLSLEPTQLERQHATYVSVNQALRRRAIGGDNTRKAGYGLYLFRIPVSVLPGEETSQGFSAVANIRARMSITKADVRHTLPRMAIADLVEALAEGIANTWNNPVVQPDIKKAIASFRAQLKCLEAANPFVVLDEVCYSLDSLELTHSEACFNELSLDIEIEKINNQLAKAVADARACQIQTQSESTNAKGQGNTSSFPQDNVRSLAGERFTRKFDPIDNFQESKGLLKASSTPLDLLPTPVQSSATGLAQLSRVDFGTGDVESVRRLMKQRFGKRLGPNPQVHEIRLTLFELFEQINIRMQSLAAYEIVSNREEIAILLAALEMELGRDIGSIGVDWRTQLSMRSGISDRNFLRASWLLARQCGLVDRNIKRMMKEMELRGDLSNVDVCAAEFINFFGDSDLAEAQRLWQLIVEEEFPLQVFTLEPLVEEQNLLDASSRLREMQIALAYSVAQGGWNVSQRVDMARRLARESAAIGLNRTVVGFAHGMDTFGWYFYPRLQSPDVEANNASVFHKICKSTGPTRRDDAQTYRLEPGIRECEVLVAMPSFVSQVEFDVTTNWESLADPGRSKRSYEELIQEGCDLQRMMACLNSTVCGPECRPGDFERLYSRAEQLSNMLGMQTHEVNVPFEYDQPATELFDQGDQELVPSINGYYGLRQLVAKDGETNVIADFFITGRNFHPTLTHVIVGGHESHSAGENANDVEILSRELIRVRTDLKTEKLAGDAFEVRVGTPGGLSNPLSIKKLPKKEPAPVSDFDWETQPKFTALVKKKDKVTVKLYSENEESKFKIKSSKDNLIKITEEVSRREGMYRNSDLVFANNDQGFELRIVYRAKFTDETSRTIKGTPQLFKFTEPITKEQLRDKIKKDLESSDPDVGLRPTDTNKGVIEGTTYLRLGNWPLIKLDTPILIELK